jgi:hypothetical protein
MNEWSPSRRGIAFGMGVIEGFTIAMREVAAEMAANLTPLVGALGKVQLTANNADDAIRILAVWAKKQAGRRRYQRAYARRGERMQRRKA